MSKMIKVVKADGCTEKEVMLLRCATGVVAKALQEIPGSTYRDSYDAALEEACKRMSAAIDNIEFTVEDMRRA